MEFLVNLEIFQEFIFAEHRKAGPEMLSFLFEFQCLTVAMKIILLWKKIAKSKHACQEYSSEM